MEHRKLKHPQKIAVSKKEMDGFCRFGDDKFINRLFTMMGRFTERIENIENQL